MLHVCLFVVIWATESTDIEERMYEICYNGFNLSSSLPYENIK